MILKRRVISVLLLLLLVGSVSGQFSEVSKIVNSTRGDRDEFGSAVDIVDNYSVVGCWREDTAAGAAYIYKKDAEGLWEATQSLKAFDSTSMAEFGSAVKISDDYVIIASGRADLGDTIRAGALYVYENEGNNNYDFTTKLTASDFNRDAKLGMNSSCLALQGNLIVAGAPGDYLWTGGVYIFEKVDESWTEKKIVDNTGQPFENFGISVSIFHDYLAVGASGADNHKGAVHIFKKDNNGDWNFIQELAASDGEANNYFGLSVSMYNGYLFVGAPGKNTEAGSSYVFKMNDNGIWEEHQIIEPENLTAYDYFGVVCEISGKYAVIGAYYDEGSAYVFKLNDLGNWEQTQQLQNSDSEPEDQFGFSVAIEYDQIIVGAIFESHDVNGGSYVSRAGSAYIFHDPTIVGIVDENKVQTQLNIFPVPSVDIITIESFDNEISGFSIFNLHGQIVKEEQLLLIKQNHSIDLSGIPTGNYILVVDLQNGQTLQEKFVKL